MSLNNVDSSSGELIATGNNGDAVSSPVVQDVADGNFSGIKNTSAKYEYVNISEATVADTLTTSSPIANGDSLVIVKDDDTIHEVVASGVTGVGPYSMDTTAVTAGEIPSKVFTVDSKVAFDDGTGFIYPSELGNNYLAAVNVSPALDLTPGLVAHYLLNNNADDSHGVYDGTPSGGVNFQGDVASFDGVDDYIDTGNLFNLNYFTASVWFRAESGAIGALGKWYDGSQRGWNIEFLNDVDIRLSYSKAGLNTAIQFTHSASLNQLYHCVLVSSDKGVEFFIDGVSVYENLFNDTGITTNNTNVFIGTTDNRGATYSFKGDISNVRLYSDAKNQAFVDDLYAEDYYPKPLTEPTTVGLIAQYPLTGTAEDSTGTYDATESANIVYVDDSEKGSVADFNGVDTAIEQSTSPTFTSISISLWIKLVADSNTQTVFSLNDGTQTIGANLLVVQRDNDNTVDVAILNTTIGTFAGVSTVGTVSTSEWTHLVVTIDSLSPTAGDITGFNVYFNDVLQSVTTKGTGGSISTNQGHMLLGHLRYSSNAQFVDGYISNVRVYDSTLTKQEITDIYNYEKNFRSIDIDDGLIAYYPLKNNSLDNYYNKYDGTDTAMTYDGESGVFSSPQSYVEVSQLGVTGDFSYSIWVKVDSFNGTDVAWITSFRSDTYFRDYLQITQNNEILAHELSSAIDTITLGEYVHLARVFSTTNGWETYLNGSLFHSTPTTTITTQTTDTNIIGSYKTISTVHSLVGNLKHFRRYNKTITAEQVAVIYNTEKEEVPGVAYLTNTRQYDDIIIDSRSIETKVELKSTGDKCTEVSADLWKIP